MRLELMIHRAIASICCSRRCSLVMYSPGSERSSTSSKTAREIWQLGHGSSTFRRSSPKRLGDSALPRPPRYPPRPQFRRLVRNLSPVWLVRQPEPVAEGRGTWSPGSPCKRPMTSGPKPWRPPAACAAPRSGPQVVDDAVEEVLRQLGVELLGRDGAVRDGLVGFLERIGELLRRFVHLPLCPLLWSPMRLSLLSWDVSPSFVTPYRDQLLRGTLPSAPSFS
jgi:hypothetical protein